MNLRKLFSKKPDSFSKEGLIIKTAFVIGGVEYLELENIFQLPAHRGLQAVKVYEELKMKCDYEYLKAHVEAVDNIKKGKEIKFKEINKIFELNDKLMERLFHISIDLDIVYKLAAVAFFDHTESPVKYDPVYALKKIEHWKKHSTVQDFFLQEPLTRLVPSLKLPSVNFQTYLQAIRAVNAVDWETVWGVLSESQRKTYSDSKSFYVTETLPESVN